MSLDSESLRADLALSRPIEEMRADLAIAAEEGFEPYSARAWWAVERLSRDVEPLLDRVEQSERVAGELREENERLREALRRRDERITDEKLAGFIARANRQSNSRAWRIVGYLARCVHDERAECEALRQRITAVEALPAEWYAERGHAEGHPQADEGRGFAAASRLCADELRAALAAEPPGPGVAGDDRKDTPPESMRWLAFADEALLTDEARQIVAWVNSHGGEARYESVLDPDTDDYSGRIRIRGPVQGVIAKPGDAVQMTEEWFHVDGQPTGAGCRDVRVFRVVSEPAGDGR